jgi:trypsin-like peptidase
MSGDPHEPLTGIVGSDPLAAMPIGSRIDLTPIVFGNSDASELPQGVRNWTFFDGALVAIAVRGPAGLDVVGTGAIIAPGLAVTATHVLRGHLEALVAGDAVAYCFGPRPGHLDIWKLRKISATDTDDIAYISLELCSDLPTGWRFTTLLVTTRCARQAEIVTVFGFRFPPGAQPLERLTRQGDLLAASGAVVAVYHPVRDRVLMPFPTIEIACGSLGGMSGGVVLDDSGMLLGVISRSFDDGMGPTSAAWIATTLNRRLEIPWPPGIYGPNADVDIRDIPQSLLHIEGRDAFVGDHLRIWFER